MEDILSLYLDSSFLLSTATTLSSQFHSLITSDSFCQRLLFLLYASLPSPATPLSSFTDLSLWEDVPSYYSLLRSLHSVGHLLGHWRSAACYLGQLLCFSLDVRAKQLVGMEVGIGGEAGANRAVMEIDLLEEEEPRCYYLEYRSTSAISSTTCVRHPALLSFQRTEQEMPEKKRPTDPGVSQSLRSSISSFFAYSAAAFASPAEPADAFTPPSVAMSSSYSYSSFTLYCPSLPSSAYLALGMQNLPTPLQRRQQTLFYPNPPSTFYRLPPPSSLSTHPPPPYPPSGLYVGQYGPHGPELMHVDYVGSELIATKVIGDANVPAGKVSFRVQLPFTVANDMSKMTSEARVKVKRGDGKRRRSKGQQGRLDERKEEKATDTSAAVMSPRGDQPTDMKQEMVLSPASKRAHLNALSMSTTVDGLSGQASVNASASGSRESSMTRGDDRIVSTASLDPHSPVSDHHAVDISSVSDDDDSSSVRNEEDETAQSDSENSDTQSVASSASLSSTAPATPLSPPQSDADAEMDTTDNLVERFQYYRRHLPPTLPSLPTLLTHSGGGTIALTGFNNPQSVAVQCFFHSGACFTLDFLGLIGFVPFVCDCHDGGGAEGVEEREERRARVRRARKSRETEIGGGVRKAIPGECTRHLVRL